MTRRHHTERIAGAVFALGLGLQCMCTAAEPFTVALVPDTQFYSASSTLITHFTNQTQWIVDNRASNNIVMVSHLGDVVNAGADAAQWARADAAMDILDTDTNLTYGVVLGNHDYAGGQSPDNDAAAFISTFGAARFAGRPWYGGDSPDGRNQYHYFKGAGRDYLHLLIEYHCASSDNSNATEMIQWVQSVLEDHPTTPAILSTHECLGSGGGRTAPGEDIFNALVKDYPQVFMVTCGHWHGEAHSTVQNSDGKDVFQILSCFQTRANGGDGWMTLLEFDEDNDAINGSTYSPSLDQYETDANSQYALSMNFSNRFDFGSGPLMGAPSVSAFADDGASVQCRLLNADADTVTLVWAESDQGATNVSAWTSAEGGGMHAFGASTNGSVPSRSLTGLDADTRYSFRFVATAGGDEDWSAEGSFATGLATLPAPSDLAGADIYGTRVDLTWADSYATETGFVIQRSTNAAFAVIDTYTVGADQTTYSDQSVETNSTYHYRIAAEGSTGPGPLSSGIVVTTTSGAPSLIGHWKFDEGTGTTAADSSFNGNDATDAAPVWTSGVSGSAVDDPQFKLADSSDLYLDGSVPFTISVWAKTDLSAGGGAFVGFEGYGGDGDIYAFKMASGKPQLTPSGTTTDDTLYNYSSAGANWVHVVGVHDPSANKSYIYVDGVQKASGSAGSIPTKTTVEFTMGIYWTDNYGYTGEMDDVQVYNAALSAEDVLELYENPGYALGDAPELPPTVVSVDPVDNATVPTPASLTITFDDGITNDVAGSITLTNLTTGATDVMGASELDISDDVLTITPDSPLANETPYAVLIDTNAIKSVDNGLHFAGYTSETNWNFTTTNPDSVKPGLVLPFSPADGATDVSVGTSLVAVFDEPIAKGTGNIVITNLTDGTATTIAVTDAQVTISNTTNLIINPTANLLKSKRYAVLIGADAIKDDPAGNFFVGITDANTWAFRTRDRGLIGHWTFDEGSGSTAADSSVNSNTATTASGSWIAGKAGQAFDDPRFTLADSSELYTEVGAAPFTISLWAKADAASGGCLAGFEGSVAGGDIYSLKVVGDKITLPPASTATPDTLMTYSDSGANWVHIVGVNEPGVNSRIYIDGVEKVTGSVASIPTQPTVEFTMGKYWNTTSYTYNGALDDVQIYDKALSDADVLYLFNNPGYALGGAPPAGSIFIMR
jgi:hypothetical protein